MEGEINAPQRCRAEYVEFLTLCLGLLVAAGGLVTASAWAFALGLLLALVSAFCYRRTDSQHLMPR
jgi:hypothetical protein